jgi:hypothetical protein
LADFSLNDCFRPFFKASAYFFLRVAEPNHFDAALTPGKYLMQLRLLPYSITASQLFENNKTLTLELGLLISLIIV